MWVRRVRIEVGLQQGVSLLQLNLFSTFSQTHFRKIAYPPSQIFSKIRLAASKRKEVRSELLMILASARQPAFCNQRFVSSYESGADVHVLRSPERLSAPGPSFSPSQLDGSLRRERGRERARDPVQREKRFRISSLRTSTFWQRWRTAAEPWSVFKKGPGEGCSTNYIRPS